MQVNALRADRIAAYDAAWPLNLESDQEHKTQILKRYKKKKI